ALLRPDVFSVVPAVSALVNLPRPRSPSVSAVPAVSATVIRPRPQAVIGPIRTPRRGAGGRPAPLPSAVSAACASSASVDRLRLPPPPRPAPRPLGPRGGGRPGTGRSVRTGGGPGLIRTDDPRGPTGKG